MPTYSYRCTQCGNAFDIQQKFTDDTLTECPSCQGALRKVFSAPAISFKGKGFYRTDNRQGRPSTETKPEKTDKVDASSKSKSETKTESSSSSDSKPAPKASEAKTA